MRETDGRGEGRTEGGKRGGQVGAASTGRKDARGPGAAATRQDEARSLTAQAPARPPGAQPQGLGAARGRGRAAGTAHAPAWRTRERRLAEGPQREGGRLLHGGPASGGCGCAGCSDTARPQGQWGSLRADGGLPVLLHGAGGSSLSLGCPGMGGRCRLPEHRRKQFAASGKQQLGPQSLQDRQLSQNRPVSLFGTKIPCS